MNRKDKQLIGFSVGSLKMLRYLHSLGIANFFELRIERFAKTGTPLRRFENGRFNLVHKNLEKLVKEFPGVRFSVHPAIERSFDITKEYGLNMAVASHQPIILQSWDSFELMHECHGIAEKIIVHPSLFHFKSKLSMAEEECLRQNALFLKEADEIRKAGGYKTKICLENTLPPKKDIGAVGYKKSYFETMLAGTTTLNTMLDTGHANLNDNLEVADYLKLKYGCVHVHFHGNRGLKNDDHVPPHRGNVRDYDTIIAFIREHRPSVVFELADLSLYSEQKLIAMVENLQAEIGGKKK